MATIRVTHYGVEGSGRTVKEAKLDAGRQIERMLEGSYQPRVIRAGKYTAVIFRTPSGGWCNSMIGDDADVQILWGSCGINDSGSDEARAEVERSVRMHLADLATDWRTCFAEADVHHVCKESRDRREIVSRCRWQRRYHAAQAFGLSDNDCHMAACGAPGFTPPAGLDLQSVA